MSKAIVKTAFNRETKLAFLQVFPPNAILSTNFVYLKILVYTYTNSDNLSMCLICLDEIEP